MPDKILDNTRFLLIQKILKEYGFILASFIILIISFFSFFFNYQNPNAPFWDENYHISSAEKYLQGTYFVELHPPLGKLFIALGEQIFQPNKEFDKKTDFVKKDYLQGDDFVMKDSNGKVIRNLNFMGYRFFPSLFAFLSGYLFFLLLYLISKKTWLSAAFSSLFLFENAFVVHFRAAMLESTQIFFILLALIYFVIEFEKNNLNWKKYLILGLLIGLPLSVKINSLVLILLFLALQVRNFFHLKSEQTTNILNFIKRLAVEITTFGLGIISVFVAVQSIHQILTPNQSEFNRYSNSQNEYADKMILDMLENKQTANPINALKTTYKWYVYQSQYTKGVPALDLTKADENGSYPTNWVVGNRTISYRWQKYVILKNEHNTYFENKKAVDSISLEKYSSLAPEEKNKYVIAVQYLYLINNPANLLLSLIGLILAFSLIIAVLVFGLKIKNNYYFSLILVFLGIYASYMFSVLTVNRVLYLYHYFVAYLLSFIISFLVFNYLQNDVEKVLGGKNKLVYLMSFLVVLVFVTFIYFAPFSYYLPLTKAEFDMRNWFNFWLMRNVG
jgi:dolichyl-phosphate-mannose-protein mannosyltransferase